MVFTNQALAFIFVSFLSILESSLASGLRGAKRISNMNINIADGSAHTAPHSPHDLVNAVIIGVDPSQLLGRCEGDCDTDDDCAGDLVCFQRAWNDAIPGCHTESIDMTKTDYCVRKVDMDAWSAPSSGPSEPSSNVPSPAPSLVSPFDDAPTFGPSLSPSAFPSSETSATVPATLPLSIAPSVGFPNVAFVRDQQPTDPKLGLCEGDCDTDADCAGNLVCYQRNRMQSVPGCVGGDAEDSLTDFCAPPDVLSGSDDLPSFVPSSSVPSSSFVVELLPSSASFSLQSQSPSLTPSSASSSAPSVNHSSAPSAAPSESSGSPAVPLIVSSSSAYGRRSIIRLPRPDEMQVGDVLVLFLSRTDDPLPLRMAGWSTAASCFKQNNGQPRCLTAEMCRVPDDGDYCKVFRFDNGIYDYDGHDLGTIVMTRTATEEDVARNEYYYDLKGGQPGWAIMAVVRGADASDPVRSHSGVSCDGVRQSRFASTYGKSNDLLLMHMGFDDTSNMDRFRPPLGSSFVSFTFGPDEAGFLFSETLTSTGMTGDRVTEGQGASECKDVSIAVVIRAGYK